MEKYEYMLLILTPIKVTFKTYGNYIHFTLKQRAISMVQAQKLKDKAHLPICQIPSNRAHTCNQDNWANYSFSFSLIRWQLEPITVKFCLIKSNLRRTCVKLGFKLPLQANTYWIWPYLSLRMTYKSWTQLTIFFLSKFRSRSKWSHNQTSRAS